MRKLLRPFEVVITWTACAIFGHRVLLGWTDPASGRFHAFGGPAAPWAHRRTCLRCGRRVRS